MISHTPHNITTSHVQFCTRSVNLYLYSFTNSFYIFTTEFCVSLYTLSVRKEVTVQEEFGAQSDVKIAGYRDL